MNTETEHETITVDKSQKNLVMVVYALYALSFITGLTAIIGVVIAHVKKGEMPGSLYDAHFSYQIRTFWWSLLGALIAVLTMFIVIGFFLAFAVAIWFIYRIVKGFLRINDGLPI